MKNLPRIAVLFVIATACGPSVVDEASALANEEAVWTAVIDSTIRPELRRLRTRPNQPEAAIVIEAQTVRIVGGTLEYFEHGAKGTGALPFEHALSAGLRQRLAQSLRARNRASGRVVLPSTNEWILGDTDDVRTTMNRDHREIGGWSELSRPGFAGRHAVVYATYTCGGRCGHGWLVLLEQRESRWHVLSADLMWMS